MSRSRIAVLVNLLQDVSVIRPLVHLAAREADAEVHLLQSAQFERRDKDGTWRAEVAALAQDVGAELRTFADVAEAYLLLQDGHGVLVAGSESNLPGHSVTHEVFRAAPAGYLRVTLQHGLECVGLLQNREHVLAHGDAVTFAADVVCAWMPPDRLASLAPSQRAKVLVTGPTSLLQRAAPGPAMPGAGGGLVCENLHSVRMRASGAHGPPFMRTFGEFCDALALAGEGVALRPHPSGQYVLKNKVPLPPNVALNNLPMYRVDLSAYAWGISAPSTVVLDMVVAGLPVGVWRDPHGVMDLSTYAGLTQISALDDWVGFVRDARVRPEAILSRQRRWLRDLGIQLDPAEAYRRFARLLVGAAAPLRASA